MNDHWELLGLPEGSTPEVVEAKWKQLRSEHHPDKGGDAQVFHQLKQAYQAALVDANIRPPCNHCHGTGRAEVRRGFNQITLMCTVCNGLGVQE